MVTGDPLDWALQQAIAEQLSVADWEDPDRCAAAIARIEEEFSKTLAKTVLDEAIAKTIEFYKDYFDNLDLVHRCC